jgi:hypothetical protein
LSPLSAPYAPDNNVMQGPGASMRAFHGMIPVQHYRFIM